MMVGMERRKTHESAIHYLVVSTCWLKAMTSDGLVTVMTTITVINSDDDDDDDDTRQRTRIL